MGFGIDSIFSLTDKLADKVVVDEIKVSLVIVLLLAAFAVIAYWYIKYLTERAQRN